MKESFSIQAGDFLFKNAFPIYDFIYPYFKRKQDKTEIDLLKQHIKPGDIVLDIGANIGFYTSILSQLAGNKGQVHAFEPDITNFKYLKRKTSHLKNITINAAAVNSNGGKITVYVSPMLNVDHRTYEPENYASKYEMDAVSIDEYLQKNKKVDFIKMDIQGFEFEALKGMEKTLAFNNEIKILSEFWPYGFTKAGCDALTVAQWIWDKGFTITLMHDVHQTLMNEKSIDELPVEEKKYFNIFIQRR
ncbi:MAG TPA: FkbM family methyltransferase [Bacteroidia bacterium]|nr:FkbM family methyltransferase [Bacteroidia bacterium]